MIKLLEYLEKLSQEERAKESLRPPTSQWVEFKGEKMIVQQRGDICEVFDADGLPFLRLSCNEPRAFLPAGWFWLTWREEAAEFISAISGILEIGEREVQASQWVFTRAARIIPKHIEGDRT